MAVKGFMSIWVISLGFPSTPARYIQIYFSDTVVVSLQLFSKLFLSQSPTTSTRCETLCKHKGLITVFGTMRHLLKD